MQLLQEKLNNLWKLTDTIPNYSYLSQFRNSLLQFRYHEEFDSCKRETFSYIQNGYRNINLTNTLRCTTPINDTMRYNSDPCCSWAASLTQCCKPHAATVKMLVLDKVLESSVNKECKNKPKITSLLADAVTVLGSEFESLSYGFSAVYQRFKSSTAFIGYCNNVVIKTPCISDADCPFKMRCGFEKRCISTPTDLPKVILECALLHMVNDCLI